MLRADLRDILQYAFPEGYAMRSLRPGEGTLWTEIQRDAECWETIGDGLFAAQFGDDAQVIGQRCFFITHGSDAVGVISAWFEPDLYGQEWGRIHWVAIRPAYQGLRLAKPAMTHAMNTLAQWHQRAFLDTSTARIPALKVYLDFGFTPDLTFANAERAWRLVKTHLPHPALDGILG